MDPQEGRKFHRIAPGEILSHSTGRLVSRETWHSENFHWGPSTIAGGCVPLDPPCHMQHLNLRAGREEATKSKEVYPSPMLRLNMN